MPTKYLVILLIIVAIGGGFYFFQKHRQNKDLQTHKTQQLQRITKIAQKSSSAGLVPMASAINKFHQVKGHYPENLLKLYPEFISDKSFILKIKWRYNPGEESFLLQKNTKEGRTVASIGPDLKLNAGDDVPLTPTKMVASVNKAKYSQQSLKKAVVSKVPSTKPDAKDNIKNNQLTKLLPQDHVKTSEGINSKKERTSLRSNFLSSVVKKKLDKNEEFLRSFDGDDFYIWKSKNGTIGFSNMQYPDEKKLAVYRNQTWIEYIEK